MSLPVDGVLAFEALQTHPDAPASGQEVMLLYVYQDGQLYARNAPVPGPGGSSTGGVPGKVWGDTFRPPLLFIDTLAAANQVPTADDLDISGFVNGDIVVRQADFEMFEYEVSIVSSGLVDLGVKWAGTIANGVPVGGATGQILAKRSATNYDTQWIAPPSGGGGAGVSNVASMNTGARAYRSAALNLAGANTWTQVAVDTKSFDPGNHINLSTGSYVVPANGLYEINADIEVTESTTGTYTDVLVAVTKGGNPTTTGTTLFQTNQWAAVMNVMSANISDVAQLAAGDVIQLWVFNGQATALATASSVNYMSVVQVDVALQPSTGQVSAGTAARANRQAAYTLPGVNAQKIPIDTINNDPGGHFNLTNSRYVCPATGWYQVNGQVCAAETGNANLTWVPTIFKNGAGYAQGDFVGWSALDGFISGTVSDTIFCNAGDYLELWVFTSSAFALSVAAGSTSNNWFSVVQVDQPIGGAGGNAVTPTTAACLSMAAAFTQTVSTWTTLPYDTVAFDAGNHMTTGAAAKYTAPVAGIYHVDATAYAPSGGAGYELALAIAVNGTRLRETSDLDSAASGTDDSQQISGLVQCAAGDQIQIMYFANMGRIVQAGINLLQTFSVVQVDQPTPVATNTGGRAFRGGALSLVAGETKIAIDTIATDPGGHMDVATNHRYNVTAAGWYQIDGGVNMNSTAANQSVSCYVKKNGVGCSTGAFATSSAASQGVTSAVSDLIFCNPGDFIELFAFNYTAGTLALGAAANRPDLNFLSVVKVDQPLYANNPSTVTALPATPFDGQEIYFVADAANGVKWHLRYNAGSSSTHKWEFLGGPNMISRVDTDEAYTATSVFALAPTPDRLTFPLSGDYEYDMTVEPYQTSGTATTSAALSINGGAAAVPDFMQLGTTGAAQTISKPGNLLNMTAGQTVAIVYQNPTGGGVTHVRYRVLRIRPVRVG